MDKLKFTFSDTIAGYVTQYDRSLDTYSVRTSGGVTYDIKLKSNTYALLTRNLGDPYQDCTGQMRDMLVAERHVFTYGIFYPQGDGYIFEAQFLVFPGRRAGEFVFERQDWWVQQIGELGKFYARAQFGDAPVDYKDYRTNITLTGEKASDRYRQETDTISRLVYGFATAYMLTGNDRFLEGAERGTEYLRDHMRFYDRDENIVYWYHGIDVEGRREKKVFASEFGDDLDAIPAYEQIYALAGPIQTYRVSGDPRILRDAELTVDLFDRFFLDREKGGYFSHLDPITLDARSEALGPNRGKKNWNSVGDHAPAYLINLWLATGEERYGKMLEYTFDTITAHFQDYEHSPFVQEKFHEDWSHDSTHMWQQNRGVVGHNLKIAWNLLRMFGAQPKPEYEAFARKIGAIMPSVGGDQQRGGWYDVMERNPAPGESLHHFAFHDRKAWWQQEQGILAYLILHGVLGDEEYLRLARESSAFYNAFFLDHDDGAVYFNVMASGVPYLMGTERLKGSHSMSGYHSFELCYLAQVYTNLLITKQPLTLYFKPLPGGFKDNILRVSPDILPANSITISEVWIDDEPYSNFDAQGLTVKLPESKERLRVRVTVQPTK
ncbi:MAG: AGE family epimerase/isomerase [Anaerolineae bacterium]|uniref:AGE family epimerase/isomerase n=1 Tax=Candidatus Amarolinea dominans TaxID=3140696 RepID=UPI001D94814E|nr:AGE family epimerase/isomerase [Anaerolineae bacterium]MBK7201614.1 AGE family epimerase/isomerase [Anaerolineae bacterium]MBK9093224.1 AGE family epimerase/isomerase [Anaerolineae bacterium]MBK9232670.1 AGE family epimerase/isomerase [Anaerolineae bacterium]